MSSIREAILQMRTAAAEICAGLDGLADEDGAELLQGAVEFQIAVRELGCNAESLVERIIEVQS